MDSEILLIAMTLMLCLFFITLIRVVLRYFEENQEIRPTEPETYNAV